MANMPLSKAIEQVREILATDDWDNGRTREFLGYWLGAMEAAQSRAAIVSEEMVEWYKHGCAPPLLSVGIWIDKLRG